MADEKMRLIRMRNRNRARFQRRGVHEKGRLADVWRKPKGRHNKLRRQIKAKGPLPRPGYGSPVAVRGLHPSGLEDVLVHNEAMIAGLDPKVHAIRIATGVGLKKKLAIQEKAMDAGIRVLNPRRLPEPEEEPAEEPAEEKAEEQEEEAEKDE